MYRKQVRRRRAVLALLIVGSFALLTLTYGQGSNGLQRGVTAVFTPLSTVLDRALKPARDLINWVDETFDARGKNHQLEEELQVARRQAVGGKVALAENEELRSLLKLDRSGAIPTGYEPVTGRVIGLSPTVWFSDVMIDVGSSDGVKLHDPVVNGDGLVGQVTALTGGTSKVTLLSDHSSVVSVKVVPAGIQGIVKPTVGDPNTLVLGFLNSDKNVHKGQSVVTAGWRGEEIESEFPPNIPVGEITKASILEQEAQERANVRPYADLRNLGTVQVLTGGSRK
ncbi:MAG TPA: rod shape-determining protein MreC [Solirubrobacterales bacterium]|nr:rod shape-determining protein MreC [Solirubrobacterales bacterium]